MSSEYVFIDRDSNSIQQATLCFLVDRSKILLALKKRGFATGLWNGVGGKVKDESIEVAARRESKEEIEVEVREMKKVAVLHFYFPDDPEKLNWNQDVHVYLCTDWIGEPKETEEMKPEWFDQDNLPYDRMWSDDSVWLPVVLKGETIKAWFAMDDDNKITASKIEKVNY